MAISNLKPIPVVVAPGIGRTLADGAPKGLSALPVLGGFRIKGFGSLSCHVFNPVLLSS